MAAIDSGDCRAISSPMRQWQHSGLKTNASGRGAFLSEPDLDLDVSVKRFNSGGSLRTSIGDSWIKSSSASQRAGMPSAWSSSSKNDLVQSQDFNGGTQMHAWWRQMETNSRATIAQRR